MRKLQNIRNHPMALLLLTVFIDLLGFGILIPVLPQIFANPHSEYYIFSSGTPVGQGYIILGFLVAVYPLAQFFATPILGQLSDKVGRKKVLAISLAGTSLGYVLFALGVISKNIPLLFLARTMDGVTGGNISVAQAAVADVTPPAQRAKNFGLMGAVFGLGFIAGPYLGGKLSSSHVVSWFTLATPFWFAAILSFLNTLSIMFFFKETNAHISRAPIVWGKSLRNIIAAYGMKNVRVLFLVNFIFQGGFTFFTTFFGVFLISKFAFDQSSIGDYFAYAGIWIVCTQAFITPLVSKKFREYQVLRVTLIVAGVFISLQLLPSVWWELLFITPFFAVANGLTQANFLGLLSRSVDQRIQGEILGINASVQALAQTAPPILSGLVAAKFSPESPLLAGSVLMVLAGGIFIAAYSSVKNLRTEQVS